MAHCNNRLVRFFQRIDRIKHFLIDRLHPIDKFIARFRITSYNVCYTKLLRLLLTEKLVVPLKNASGETLAWCAAVPFLRSADLRTTDDEPGDKLINGVQSVYQEVFDTINTLRKPSQPIIAMGHAYRNNFV